MSRSAYGAVRARLSYSIASGEKLDGLLDLLGMVEATGSLAAAAARLEVSYRSAWGLVSLWQRRLGSPLLQMERGRGSRLAPLGARLVEAERMARVGVEAQLAAAGAQLQQALAADTGRAPRTLRLRASHDLLLDALAGLMEEAGGRLEIETRGSLEALEEYRAQRCDLAGVHSPRGVLGDPIRARYLVALRGRGHRAIRFATRTQGLMVAPGNPRHIGSIADLQRPGLRFINRQSGAGTRLLLDLLLARQGIAPGSVPGYGRSEFTHAAVAATIASGAADAGLGIAAAAARFGLDFVPLLQEDYFLVGRSRQGADLERICTVLRSAGFRQAAAGLGGYDLGEAGDTISVEEAFGPRPAPQ
jgi:molybdate transport repressor ModE-like protein